MKISFLAFVAGMFCWTVIAQTADEQVNQGLSALSVQDLNRANNNFASAVALSSTNANANALYAITRLLVLSSQPAGSNFLTRIGIPVSGRNLYDWTADVPEDTNGVPLAPSGVNADEFTVQLRTNVLNSVTGAVANLSQIADTNFTMNLTSNETSIAAVTMDYGDFKLIQAGLYAVEYFIYTANAQNVDAELTDIRALYTDRNLSAQSILTNYPQLFTFATTNDLQAARTAFTNGVNAYLAASAFIRGRPAIEVRLFNYDQVSEPSEATFRSVLQDLESSLAGARVLAADTNLTINFATQFTGTTTWRSLLPAFKGNAIDTGSFLNSVAVPDPTFGGVVGGLTQAEVEMFLDKHFGILQSFGSVQNGGFETHDFTDWTLTGSDTFDMFVGDGSETGIDPYSGYYISALGPVGSLSYLSQTLGTTAGVTYSLSLWLENFSTTNNEFLVSWNGQTIFHEKNMPSFGWTNLQFSVVATGSSTFFEFGSRNDPDYFYLDDVSVLASAPQVTTISLPNGTNGIAYTQTLVTSGGQSPYGWTNLSGTLPPGVALATNGVISGTPMANGTFNFTVMVSDALSEMATQALALTVVGPPIVAIQPTNNPVVVAVGSNVTFSVSVTGTGPFCYQWQINGTNLPNGIIATVAGNGTAGYSGDGGAATNAEFFLPYGVAVDAADNLFIGDFYNNRVRKVGINGVVTTVAGNGLNYYIGDGGPAANAELNGPAGLAFDAGGNLFIADVGNNVIRKVGTNGIITTVAGNGYGAGAGGSGNGGYSGDGGAATNAELNGPNFVALDLAGDLFISDVDNHRVRKVGTNGIISTVAGNGTSGYSGDGGAATNAELSSPIGLALDAAGNLFIADIYNLRIRKVDKNGIITTVAGNGTYPPGHSGDGGAATNAELYDPYGLVMDTTGNLFIGDSENQRIRKVGTNGIITTVAGNGYGAGTGNGGYSGDGGTATNAELNSPEDVAMDTTGNLLIADVENQRIRKVFIQGPTLVLNDGGVNNAGAYDVVVSSPYGSVTSSVVNVIITFPPAVLSSPQLSVGKTNFTFRLSGPADSNYVLQVSADLMNWNSINTSTIPVSGFINLSNTIGGLTNRAFYRVYLK